MISRGIVIRREKWIPANRRRRRLHAHVACSSGVDGAGAAGAATLDPHGSHRVAVVQVAIRLVHAEHQEYAVSTRDPRKIDGQGVPALRLGMTGAQNYKSREQK